MHSKIVFVRASAQIWSPRARRGDTLSAHQTHHAPSATTVPRRHTDTLRRAPIPERPISYLRRIRFYRTVYRH